MTDGAPYCRDCRHCKPANPLLYWGRERHRYARCFAPRQISGNGLIHPILEQGSFCSINRLDPDRCGPSGSWYESNE